jgi:hypothetical protein
MAKISVNVVPVSATIRSDQRDRLLSFAKHSGAISISEALRELLDRALPPLAQHVEEPRSVGQEQPA